MVLVAKRVNRKDLGKNYLNNSDDADGDDLEEKKKKKGGHGIVANRKHHNKREKIKALCKFFRLLKLRLSQ